MDGVRRVHFVGIGGAGMCGIAEVLLGEGYAVSGSDLARSAVTDRLARLGACVSIGHRAEAVAGADAVVASAAVPAANAELARARALGVPVLPRAEMLNELMRDRRAIAIAGSHGKTTTAAMLASVFDAAGLDPTFVIGGAVTDDGGNARLGDGRHLIAEADESDASFLRLSPRLALITNVDADHLGAYGRALDRLEQAFADFARRLPFYGTLAYCADDERLAEVAGKVDRRRFSYGFKAGADCAGGAVDAGGAGAWSFEARRAGADALRLSTPLPGCHNVVNALAAVALATLEGVADDAIVAGLAEFRGVRRRFETADLQLAGKRFTLLDDYGHHPTEVGRVIDAARGIWPGRRLVMVFQPHRFSRTRDLFDDFSAVLSRPDMLIVAEVYPAGEAPVAGADGAALADAIARRGAVPPLYAESPDAALAKLLALLADGDVVAIQGAGDVDQVAAALRAEAGCVADGPASREVAP